MTNAPQELRAGAAAAFLGKSPATLRWWRLKKIGPKFRTDPVSGWTVYTLADLTAYRDKENDQ